MGMETSMRNNFKMAMWNLEPLCHMSQLTCSLENQTLFADPLILSTHPHLTALITLLSGGVFLTYGLFFSGVTYLAQSFVSQKNKALFFQSELVSMEILMR